MVLHLNFSSEEIKIRQNKQEIALLSFSHANILPSSSFHHPIADTHKFCHDKNSDDDDDDDNFDDTDEKDYDDGYDEEGTDYNDDTFLLF